MNKKFKIFFISLLTLLVIVNAVILITDNTYIYTAFLYTTANIDDHSIFNNRVVKADKGIDWVKSNNYNKLKLPYDLITELTDLKTVAFLVIKNDSIQYEKYWDGYGENSISNSFSMAKSIIGILTGIAIDEGKIKNIDQKVSDFLPEFSTGEKSNITIRYLLTMSSGLNWHEVYMSPVSYTTEAYYGTDLLKLINKLNVETTPGTTFLYKSCDTQILGFALSKAVNRTISEYASEKLWIPLQAKNDALWSTDSENGFEKTFCCFNSNARDFARIGKLFLNKGKWNERQIISEDFVKQSLTPIMIKDDESAVVDYYGFSWWLINHQGNNFYARGILGQYLIIIPEKNIIIVRLGHKRNLQKFVNHPKDVYTIIDGVCQIF